MLCAGINQILSRNEYSSSNPVCIETKYTDPKCIANAFNSHYQVADKIMSKTKYKGNKPYHKYLKNPYTLSSMMTATSSEEVKSIV